MHPGLGQLGEYATLCDATITSVSTSPDLSAPVHAFISIDDDKFLLDGPLAQVAWKQIERSTNGNVSVTKIHADKNGDFQTALEQCRTAIFDKQLEGKAPGYGVVFMFDHDLDGFSAPKLDADGYFKEKSGAISLKGSNLIKALMQEFPDLRCVCCSGTGDQLDLTRIVANAGGVATIPKTKELPVYGPLSLQAANGIPNSDIFYCSTILDGSYLFRL